jgi:putative two-component system response regulator
MFEDISTATPGARILIVDDDPVVSGVLAVTLTVAGYEVIEANSGEMALAECHQTTRPKPDVVLLDIEMWDGIDGFEVCRQLKANKATSHIPVIFVTAKNDHFYEKLCFAIGAVGYITKPIIPAIVLARIKHLLTLKTATNFLPDHNFDLERETAAVLFEDLAELEAAWTRVQETLVTLIGPAALDKNPEQEISC